VGVVRLLLLVTVAAIVACAVAAGPAPSARSVYADRAAAAFRALQQRLLDTRTNAYRETAQPPAAHAWPASQAVSAAIALARLKSASPASLRLARDAIARLERFRSGALYQAWPGGDVYYDDNEWIARDALDAYEAWGRTSDLATASRIFGAVVGAWDGEPAHPCSGGIKWTTAAGNSDRNTVTTANAAVVGLRLYAATKRSTYLTWSQLMLGWLDRCMLAPDGLYGDHVDAAGAVDATEWSYNQGSVVEANLLLYRLTGDTAALQRAEAIADAALQTFASRWDGEEPPEFAAVFFRALLQLAATDGRTDYVDDAEAYAALLWQRRDARTGLVRFGGPTRLLDQAAAVQVFAALAAAGR
jgi:glycosyl hydrolase family 76